MASEEVDWLEALDWAVQEVEALQAIYVDDGEGDDSSSTCLTVKSSRELEAARNLVDAAEPLTIDQIPSLELEMNISTDAGDDGSAAVSVRLYFGLPPGYPLSQPIKVSVLTAEGFVSRSARDDLTCQLQEKAQEMIGSEAVMELIQCCQERLVQLQSEAKDKETQSAIEDSDSTALGRRWIWVHHIKDRQRKEDIVREAQERALGGYLKAGYPGIVVVEGPRRACDEFVMWIKGNKSRPGGFGRQWGHHVRGELEISSRQLPETFVALEEDMSVLSAQCREQGLEEEFLKFVMQHG